MTRKRENVALLLKLLAQGKDIKKCARELGLSLESARQVLLNISLQYSGKSKKENPLKKPKENGSGSKAIAYIDGGSRGNPGPAGCGAIFFSGKENILAKEKLFLGRATNNVAEYKGLILALEKAIALDIQVLEIRSDSKLLVEQMNRRYKVKSPLLAPLFEEAKILARNLKSVRYTHVGREENIHADRLANLAMDEGE